MEESMRSAGKWRTNVKVEKGFFLVDIENSDQEEGWSEEGERLDDLCSRRSLGLWRGKETRVRSSERDDEATLPTSLSIFSSLPQTIRER